jgi:UPF0716 protein FxsA
MAILVALFVVVPIVELYVLVQVSHAIGFGNALGLLILISAFGAWVVKRQGVSMWRRLQLQLANRQVPAKEVVNGLLILLAGGLLLVPGFVTDALGLLLLLPPVRAGVRTLLVRRWAGEVTVISATHAGPIDTTATEPRRPELGR